jgi:hypothetical protein
MGTNVAAAPPLILQFLNNAGLPNVGGSVLTQVGGVNYPTFQDAAGTTALPNPIPLNSRGEISNSSGVSSELFLATGVVYTITLMDPTGNTIWIAENVVGSAAEAVGAMTDEKGAGGLPGFVNGVDFTAGTTESLTLSGYYGSTANLWIAFDGTEQGANSYQLSGYTLTFGSYSGSTFVPAPIPLGTNVVFVKGGTTLTIGTPGAGTVTDASVAANAAINSSKLSYVPTFAGGVARSVQIKLGDFVTVGDYGAVSNTTTDNSTDLQNMCTVGGNGFWIPAGTYKFGTGLTINYNPTGTTFPGIGEPSARMDILGESIANAILNYSGTGYAITMTGGDNAGVNQGIHSLDIVRAFTLQDNAQAQSNSGISMTNRAWWKLEDVIFNELNIALNIVSSFSAAVKTSYFNSCEYGIQLNTDALGPPNEIVFDGLVFQSNTLAAILGVSMGTNLIFRNCSFESNGTMGNNNTGAFVGNLSGAYGCAGPITFDNCYFENSAGVADISIDNPTTHAATVIIRNCIFQRISSTNYVTTNISVTNSGGGPVTVLLEGNSFFSTGTYVPSASRPFYEGGSTGISFVDNGGNVYSETTSLVNPAKSGRALIQSLYDGATSTAIVANGCTPSRTAAGGYTFTFTNPLPSAAYVPLITVDRGSNDSISYQITSQTASAISIACVNQTGAATDSPNVSLAIIT